MSIWEACINLKVGRRRSKFNLSFYVTYWLMIIIYIRYVQVQISCNHFLRSHRPTFNPIITYILTNINIAILKFWIPWYQYNKCSRIIMIKYKLFKIIPLFAFQHYFRRKIESLLSRWKYKYRSSAEPGHSEV